MYKLSFRMIESEKYVPGVSSHGSFTVAVNSHIISTGNKEPLLFNHENNTKLVENTVREAAKRLIKIITVVLVGN